MKNGTIKNNSLITITIYRNVFPNILGSTKYMLFQINILHTDDIFLFSCNIKCIFIVLYAYLNQRKATLKVRRSLAPKRQCRYHFFNKPSGSVQCSVFLSVKLNCQLKLKQTPPLSSKFVHIPHLCVCVHVYNYIFQKLNQYLLIKLLVK